MQTQKQAETYSREQYATADFWNSRYKQKQTYFDWYAQYPELKQSFEQHYNLKKEDYILMVGCGNSKVSQQMYKAGYSRICNIDISPVVIQQMKKVTQGMEMQWLVMDATQLTFADSTFDCIIDKGTMDALVSGNNLAPVEKMINQLNRVMKKDGQMLLITYGSPEGRKRVFEGSIGLTKFDYYFTRVDLNDQSTLINLMRSNLGNRPLVSIMKDKDALVKSMMEYNFVQALRRKRKNQKFVIGWDKYQKKQVKFNDIEQQTSKQPANLQSKEIESKQHIKKQEEHIQSCQQSESGVGQQKKQPPKKNYNPRKQCYCYVYSIRHKYTANLDEIIKNLSNQPIENIFQGAQQKQQIISIKATDANDNKAINLLLQDQQAIKDALLACKYLQLQGITHPLINITTKFQQLQKLPKSQYSLRVIRGDSNCCFVLKKSQLIFSVQRVQESKITPFQSFLDFLGKSMIQQFDLHPTPQIYSFLNIIKEKLNISMINILKKYWYPTWKYQSVNADSIVVVLSLPPITPLQTLEKDLSNKLKSQRIKILSRKQGYSQQAAFGVVAAMNEASLSWNDGQKIKLIVQDFPKQFDEQAHYNQILTFSVRRNMRNTLAHLFSLV